jgi:hypothetical protein
MRAIKIILKLAREPDYEIKMKSELAGKKPDYEIRISYFLFWRTQPSNNYACKDMAGLELRPHPPVMGYSELHDDCRRIV